MANQPHDKPLTGQPLKQAYQEQRLNQIENGDMASTNAHLKSLRVDSLGIGIPAPGNPPGLVVQTNDDTGSQPLIINTSTSTDAVAALYIQTDTGFTELGAYTAAYSPFPGGGFVFSYNSIGMATGPAGPIYFIQGTAPAVTMGQFGATGGLVIGAPTGGDKGLGTINVVQSHAAVLALRPVLYAGLPGAPVEGMVAYITDASSITFNAVVTGLGGNKTLVQFDGTDWRVA